MSIFSSIINDRNQEYNSRVVDHTGPLANSLPKERIHLNPTLDPLENHIFFFKFHPESDPTPNHLDLQEYAEWRHEVDNKKHKYHQSLNGLF